MFLVSDIPAIEAVYASFPEPLSAREEMMGRYPGATIDALGRAHAPFEGYTVNDVAYRAGEFLPKPEEPNGQRGNSRVSFVENVGGEDFQLVGSRDFIRAVREEAKRQEFEADIERGYVGEVGKRSVFSLTLFSVYSDHNEYGWNHSHVFRTDSGERVLYKGSVLLADEGERISVKATVFAHHTGKDGRRSTIVKRPTICK